MARKLRQGRPGRGVAEAVAAARAHVVAGRAHVVRVDIVRFFERVPQGMLLAELPHWVTDPQLRGIVGQWLRASAPGGRGLPQGAPISPLLANIHLDAVDRALDAAGVIFVRYADDIAAFARTDRQGRDVLATIEQALATRGLAVNAAKSGVVHASTGVAYLGKHLAKRRFGFLAGVAAWWRRRSIATRDPWAALGDRGD